MIRRRETRPSTTPVPVRFTDTMLEEVAEVAALFDVSRQDVIRISVAAGLKSMRRLGWDGLTQAVADQLPVAERWKGAADSDPL